MRIKIRKKKKKKNFIMNPYTVRDKDSGTQLCLEVQSSVGVNSGKR